jgi:hypothetical protein
MGSFTLQVLGEPTVASASFRVSQPCRSLCNSSDSARRLTPKQVVSDRDFAMLRRNYQLAEMPASLAQNSFAI